MYWHTASCTGTLPHVLAHRLMYWHIASCTGTLPHVLAHCPMYWHIASCTGTSPHVLAHYPVHTFHQNDAIKQGRVTDWEQTNICLAWGSMSVTFFSCQSWYNFARIMDIIHCTMCSYINCTMKFVPQWVAPRNTQITCHTRGVGIWITPAF